MIITLFLLVSWSLSFFFFFFFNDTPTTAIYTLSLHDALPIFPGRSVTTERKHTVSNEDTLAGLGEIVEEVAGVRSEEHTSELQSRPHLVCRLLLEKKKKKTKNHKK